MPLYPLLLCFPRPPEVRRCLFWTPSLTVKDPQPTLASQRLYLTQPTGPGTSQFLPERNTRLHVTLVSKQFPSLILQRPSCSGDSLSYSSPPLSISAVDSAMELEHTEGASGVGLSTGATSEQSINTGFGTVTTASAFYDGQYRGAFPNHNHV